MKYSPTSSCTNEKKNLRGVGTFQANRIGFASNLLKMDEKCEKGSYIRLFDKRHGMVITRRNDSQILQVFSTVMNSVIGTKQQSKWSNLLDV